MFPSLFIRLIFQFEQNDIIVKTYVKLKELEFKCSKIKNYLDKRDLYKNI